jgi:hypothetical protein
MIPFSQIALSPFAGIVYTVGAMILLFRCMLLVTLFLLVGGSSAYVLRPLAAAQVPSWGDKGSPFGVVAALGNRVRSDEIDRAVALLREAGVQWQREEIFWHEVQKQPDGPYDWDGNEAGLYNYDKAISAQRAAGIRMLGLLDYSPAWFKGKAPRPEEWIDDWGDFVYNTVARYGREQGAIKYWELWNEPNLATTGYETGLYTVNDFVRVLEVGSAAAKAADPEAQIVLGGLASIWSEPPSPYHYDYFDYLDRVARLGGWKHVDILAIHPYRPDSPEGEAWRRNQSLTFRDELNQLDALLAIHGPKPVWLTELGWPSSTGHLGVDADRQAFYLVRSYLLALAHPGIEKIFWYDFRNDTAPNAPYEQPVYNDGEKEFHYGLLRRHYPLDPNRADLRKPAFVAYRTMTDLLAGLVLNGTLSEGAGGLYHYRFNGGGRQVDLLWVVDQQANNGLRLPCSCREALVRNWNGEVLQVVYAAAGHVELSIPAIGAPLYVEYDPPARGREQRFAATGHSLGGAFRRFWAANGGLPRFGYPLTEELIEPEPGTGKPRTVQYFERAKFVHYPELGPPGEVQLARLGDLALQRQGIDWQTLPRVTEAPPECRIFPETGHSLCPPLLGAWEQAGGLALVGYPLTEAYPSVTSDGQPYTVQYFERTRLEQHGTSMQLGLLGRELFTK